MVSPSGMGCGANLIAERRWREALLDEIRRERSLRDGLTVDFCDEDCATAAFLHACGEHPRHFTANHAAVRFVIGQECDDLLLAAADVRRERAVDENDM